MPEDKSIFNVEVNERGSEQIRRIHNLTRTLFWANLIVHLTVLGFSTANTIRIWRVRLNISTTSTLTLRLWFYPMFLLLSFACIFFNTLYFLRFTRSSKESLANNDSRLFNESFQWIYRSLTFGAIALALYAVQFVVDYFLFRF